MPPPGLTPEPGQSFFDCWWQTRGEPYEQAVIEAGGTPWPGDPSKRIRVAGQLGVSVDTPDYELRRALWNRRYQQPAPPAMPPTSLKRIRREH